MYTTVGIVFLSVCVSRLVSGNTTADLVDKPILRYGFQYTQDCDNFEKAFICIQKCQDLNYDSAVTDKHCKCTCYMKQELQKHKVKSNTTRNDWKSGAPTTKLPIWAQKTNTDDVTDDYDDDTADASSSSGNAVTGHKEPLSGNESSTEGQENVTLPTNSEGYEEKNGTDNQNDNGTINDTGTINNTGTDDVNETQGGNDNQTT